MTKQSFALALKALKDYQQYEFLVKKRRQEIMFPHYEGRDNNFGGGRAQNKVNKHVEDLAIKLANDPKLNWLALEKEAVDACLSQMDSFSRNVIQKLFFEKSDLSTTGLAITLQIARSTLYNIRHKFLAKLNELLTGWE